nr:unnamed protein product [Digitaria exilis]
MRSTLPLLLRRSAAASRSLRSSRASAPCRWSPRVAPSVPRAAGAGRVSRCALSSSPEVVALENFLPQLDRSNLALACMTARKNTRKKVTGDAILLCGDGPPDELSDDQEFECLDMEQLHDDFHNYPVEDVDPLFICPYSTHRDGYIYKGAKYSWKKNYRIKDRNEKASPAGNCLLIATYVLPIPACCWSGFCTPIDYFIRMGEA